MVIVTPDEDRPFSTKSITHDSLHKKLRNKTSRTWDWTPNLLKEVAIEPDDYIKICLQDLERGRRTIESHYNNVNLILDISNELDEKGERLLLRMEKLPSNTDKISFFNNKDLPIVILDRFLADVTLPAGFSFRALEDLRTVGYNFLSNSPAISSDFSFAGLDHI